MFAAAPSTGESQGERGSTLGSRPRPTSRPGGKGRIRAFQGVAPEPRKPLLSDSMPSCPAGPPRPKGSSRLRGRIPRHDRDQPPLPDSQPPGSAIELDTNGAKGVRDRDGLGSRVNVDSPGVTPRASIAVLLSRGAGTGIGPTLEIRSLRHILLGRGPRSSGRTAVTLLRNLQPVPT